MANPEHLDLLREGAAAWNEWMRERRKAAHADDPLTDVREMDIVDLSGADLKWTNLERFDLANVDMSDANLEHARLFWSQLDQVNLSRASLCNASLDRAVLKSVNFTAADLTSAACWDATFFEATFCRANLQNTKLWNTVFMECDLSDAEGIGNCEHSGPSMIDFRTLQLSSNVPSSFLRGCGFIESHIEQLQELLAKPFLFYSCFISYAAHGEDDWFAHRLHADLQAKGVRCWFAPKDLRIGDEHRLTFDEAIRRYDKLLVVLSERSIQRPWVKREVEQALDEEQRRGEHVLFPIRLDDAVLEVPAGWATDVRRRHIGDFRSWREPDRYDGSLYRLLQDLRHSSGCGRA